MPFCFVLVDGGDKHEGGGEGGATRVCERRIHDKPELAERLDAVGPVASPRTILRMPPSGLRKQVSPPTWIAPTIGMPPLSPAFLPFPKDDDPTRLKKRADKSNFPSRSGPTAMPRLTVVSRLAGHSAQVGNVSTNRERTRSHSAQASLAIRFTRCSSCCPDAIL